MSLRWEDSWRKKFVKSRQREIAAGQAMHQGTFLSSWLREVGEDNKERKMVVDRETKEEGSNKRTREEEKEENETVIVKRRCVNLVLTEAFDFFCQGGIRRAVVTLGFIFGMNLVACLIVVL